ncbi:MAG: hypothetical protein IPM03_22345 [Sulfuritalea sp.]|nr:hypothetical protein [Sulfuritalea sp.]
MIELSKIRIDGGTQTREKLNEATVKEYIEAINAGATFPPVTLFFDGSNYWLADGFHRYFATKKAGKKQIHEDITPGTQRDAVLHSLGANTAHGLPRSNKDKQRAVETLLNDPEWSNWSNREIAEKCAVSHGYVNTLRDKMKSGHVSTPANASGKPPNPEQSKPDTEDQPGQDATEDNPAAQEPANQPPKEPEYTELDKANDTIAGLQDALALAAAGELSAEEKKEATSLVDQLRSEIKTLKAELRAMTVSRDGLQTKVAELMKQCAMQRKQLKQAA